MSLMSRYPGVPIIDVHSPGKISSEFLGVHFCSRPTQGPGREVFRVSTPYFYIRTLEEVIGVSLGLEKLGVGLLRGLPFQEKFHTAPERGDSQDREKKILVSFPHQKKF
eukprot:TRINITY_DN20020_c0_g1_i1.p1 TRINITY_DN20020_c0_g1~~TRINITY_DN20020_c0_g1_i1.p1  ORF type:complete len:109 (+),score=12.86 TRINITY_DN20020_c0_g1_i1:83-409(+)